MVGMAEIGAPVSLDEVAVHPDCLPVLSSFFLQCFDAVGWAAGWASGL